MFHPHRLIIIFFLSVWVLLTSCNGNPFEENSATDSVTTITAPQPGPDATPRLYIIQSGSSQAGYAVQEELFGQEVSARTTVGGTTQVEGFMELTIDPTNGGVALGENQITVNIESLTSDEGRRDNRIREEWLESSTYPVATFVATDIQNFPAGLQPGQEAIFQLVGNLTIRDVTRPTTFTTTAILNGNQISGTATTMILMRDFGFDPPGVMGVLSVTDGVTVTLRFVMQEG
jgi:polyisoprenoid-binding protein YceI